MNSSGDRIWYLNFHGLGECSRPFDPGEEDVWLDERTFRDIVAACASMEDVRWTFDDGNKSDIQIGVPVLLEHGLRGEFFIVADRVGRDGFLTQTDLREMAAAGMRIGCHGMKHQPWRHLSDGELHQELVQAKDTLEQMVGQPITTAACPFGEYDRRVLRHLRAAGYHRVYTSDQGCARPGQWLSPRNTLRRSATVQQVQYLLQSGDRNLDPVRSLKLMMKRWR